MPDLEGLRKALAARAASNWGRTDEELVAAARLRLQEAEQHRQRAILDSLGIKSVPADDPIYTDGPVVFFVPPPPAAPPATPQTVTTRVIFGMQPTGQRKPSDEKATS